VHGFVTYASSRRPSWIPGLILAVTCLPTWAQNFTDGDLETQFLEPPVEWQADDTAVPLRFVELRQIAVPGPLREEGPSIADGDSRFNVAVEGGWAWSGWGERSELELRTESLLPTTENEGWQAWGEKRRYRTDPDGWLVAEKRCGSCRRGWRRLWRLRVSGHTPAPPLVDDRRIVFASLDNQIYGVRRRNGHRLWVADLGQRISRSLVSAPIEDIDHPEGAEAKVILVIPDDGRKMLALDPLNGSTAATYSLSNPDDRLVGSPVVTPNGLILVARQGYDPRSASVVVLSLVPPDREDGDDVGEENGYNDGSDRAAASPETP